MKSSVRCNIVLGIHALTVLLSAQSLLWCADSRADESSETPSTEELTAVKRNLAMKTLGGRQFWGDVALFHDWRIQHNVVTGHYRLLDGGDYRHCYGTRAQCREKLEQMKTQLKLPPMKGKAVILIHGIIRSSKSFAKMRKELKADDRAVFGFDYPSTRVEIPKSAEYLHQAIESLEGIDQIDLVVHSMGGLVVRAYLAEHRDPRIQRMVMLGVPNLGAQMADRFKPNYFFKAVFGPAGQQLTTATEGLIAGLPTPDFEFGILSGARGTLDGYNILIPGDDDGTVTVACTRLPGAADFATVPCLHSFLIADPAAIQLTRRFLQDGHFREDGEKHPIPKEQQAAEGEKAAK